MMRFGRRLHAGHYKKTKLLREGCKITDKWKKKGDDEFEEPVIEVI